MLLPESEEGLLTIELVESEILSELSENLGLLPRLEGSAVAQPIAEGVPAKLSVVDAAARVGRGPCGAGRDRAGER